LQGKYRASSATFLVEGPQAIREVLASAWPVIDLFVTGSAAARYPELVESARKLGSPVHLCDAGALASLTDTKSSQELVAVVESDRPVLREVIIHGVRLVAGLIDCNDPGNLGSVIRVADAAGATAVVLTPDSVDRTNPKAVRASTGSLFHLPVVPEIPWHQLCQAARAAGLQVLATTGDPDATDLDELSDSGRLLPPTLWLFGTEARGLPAEVLAAADVRVRIPLHGRAESLNLAAAAAVCLYASAKAQRS
jgi:TrmH family RNA methyltransferase